MDVITRKHGAVAMKDATGTPISASLSPSMGDFSYSGAESGNAEAIAIYNRGEYYGLVEGDDKTITGSITVIHDGDLTDATNKLAIDAVMKTGAFSAGVSTDPGLVVWTTDIVLTSTRGGVVHTHTLTTCRCTYDYSEANDGNKIVINFTCYEGVTVTSA